MKPEIFLNRTIAKTTGVRETKGSKFGIELELEGRNVGMADVATKGWLRHHEQSLRGESIEYTTAGAKSLADTERLVDDLFKKFKEHKVEIKDSVRAGTHVHLNFSDRPVKCAINFFTLFTLLEELLQYYSGEDRKGNLFCVSTREAEGIMDVLHGAVEYGDLSRFNGDRFKYAACNMSTLYKFGTIEIRTMRAAMSSEQINAWVNILNDMYEYSIDNMQSPADLVRDLSFLGAEAFLKKVFKPNNFKELMKSFPDKNLLPYSLMEGARIIQVFAYEFEEAFRTKVEEKKLAANALPLKIPFGPFQGQLYCIYKPNGERWNVSNMFGIKYEGMWKDGERVIDDKRIYWSEEHQRFVVKYANDDIVMCNWQKHHDIPDEGPPVARRAMPRDIEAFEAEIFEDDEEEEIPFDEDEGDDF